MVETTRRKAVASIGGLMFISGCSDAIGSDDESDANGAGDGPDGSDDEAGDANGTGDGSDGSDDDEDTAGDGSDPNGTGDEDPEDDPGEEEEEADGDDNEAADGETDTDSQMSTEEFVNQLETDYRGEVADYEEDDTHGFLTLVAEEDTSTLELMNDMDGILTTYSTYVEGGDAPAQQLEGEVETTDGDKEVDNFTVETEWVEAYNRGELSEEELQDRVLETVET